MISVYLAGSLPDAQLCRLKLLDAGIPCELRNEFLQGALGELPVTLQPEVCVLREADVARARELVEEFEATAPSADGEERKCSQCGELSPANFELCWKCRAPFEAA